MSRSRDRSIAKELEAWFTVHARDLPWRTEVRDGYQALVAEAMLQQTQVSRVVEKYEPFLERFPTALALAEADEDAVLASWSGLGYYRRARNLHAAAKQIVADHGGEVPSEPDRLLELKGVGRYTAGAIASIAYNIRAPIVDGNVERVTLRLEGEALQAGSKEASDLAWERAETLVDVSKQPGVFNEGLMELGATVCTPRGPRCGQCPLKRHCRARTAGAQEEIPQPKARAKQKELFISVAVIRDGLGNTLVRQRPLDGLWGGLWEPISLESSKSVPELGELAQTIGVDEKILSESDAFTHVTTHRLVRFLVFEGVVDRQSGLL
ncbi:MAG: A/G-specific adenine glycosylase, partial [Planctomycetota bacterium]